MYMHIYTHIYVHIHTQNWLGPVTRGWILQASSLWITLSRSHFFSFSMGGSLCSDKHGRGVLATASSQENQRCLCRAARFQVVRWLRSQRKQRWRPAGTQPA